MSLENGRRFGVEAELQSECSSQPLNRIPIAAARSSSFRLSAFMSGVLCRFCMIPAAHLSSVGECARAIRESKASEKLCVIPVVLFILGDSMKDAPAIVAL